MLYEFYEMQRALMEPLGNVSTAFSKIFDNPHSPFGQLPWSPRLAASYNLFQRIVKTYEKPKFGIHSIPVEGVNVTILEQIEVDKPFCQLRRFKRYTDDAKTLEIIKNQPVVLIVAPLSGHHATLLRDTAKSLLNGHKVYITDWKNARDVPISEGDFSLDDNVHYVEEFIRYLQQQYGNCHVISVCQPTVPTLGAVSLMASHGEKLPKSLIMMGGPVDARCSPTAVNSLANDHSMEWFENNVIYRVPAHLKGAGRRVYPGFLQHLGFVAMNPSRHMSSHYDYFENLLAGDEGGSEQHRTFYDEYNAVLDMDAIFYLDTIKVVFQDFSLANGTWQVKNADGISELVKPSDIRNLAILTIEGELDDISGKGQTRAALDLCTNVDDQYKQHLEVTGAGHYGIFSGSRWRNQVYPVVRDFILNHEQDKASQKKS